MLRVGAPHLFCDITPAARPKARQIPRRLDRVACGGGEREDQRHPIRPNDRMVGYSKQRLHAQFHHRAAVRPIINRVRGARRRREICRRQPIQHLLPIPAHQAAQGIAPSAFINIRQSSFADEQGGQPEIQRCEQGGIGHSVQPGPMGPGAQPIDRGGPGQDCEAMGAHSLEQSLGNGLQAGGAVLPLGERDGPQMSPAFGAHAARCGIKTQPRAAFHLIRKKRVHLRAVDWHGRHNPRARSRPLNIGNRQPIRAGQGRSRVKAEAPAADADPIFAACVTPLGQPVGKAQRDDGGEIKVSF